MNEFYEAQRQVKPSGVSGWWVKVLADIDQTRRDQLIEAASDPNISHRAIAVVLQRWGYSVSPGSVGHWRRNHA